jgi:hypothetical protein
MHSVGNVIAIIRFGERSFQHGMPPLFDDQHRSVYLSGTTGTGRSIGGGGSCLDAIFSLGSFLDLYGRFLAACRSASLVLPAGAAILIWVRGRKRRGLKQCALKTEMAKCEKCSIVALNLSDSRQIPRCAGYTISHRVFPEHVLFLPPYFDQHSTINVKKPTQTKRQIHWTRQAYRRHCSSPFYWPQA